MHLSSKWNFTDERQARRFQLGVRNLNYGTTVTCGEATAKSSELAGNVEALAALMNRSATQGITVKAIFKDSCLQILLESAQVPNQH